MINVSQQYCDKFRKIEQAELVENLPQSYLLYIIYIQFYCEKKWK